MNDFQKGVARWVRERLLEALPLPEGMSLHVRFEHREVFALYVIRYTWAEANKWLRGHRCYVKVKPINGSYMSPEEAVEMVACLQMATKAAAELDRIVVQDKERGRGAA